MKHKFSSPSFLRALWIAVILTAAGSLFLLVSVTSNIQAGTSLPHGWNLVFTETFESGFPSQSWIVTNTTQPDGFMWGATTLTASQAVHSAWVIGQPASLTLTGTYTNNMSTWMAYGPLTLTEYVDAQLSFDVWLDTAEGDYLIVGANTYTGTPPLSGLSPSNTLPGTIFTGTQRAWRTVTLSLQTMAGKSSVWIYLGFLSDNDNHTATGVLVDNLTLFGLDSYRIYLPIVARRWPPVPYTPSLNPINVQSGTYTVTWSAADLAASYLLQEDESDLFSSPTDYAVGNVLQKVFTSVAPGTHYYRVQALNAYGSSEWSNIVSATIVPGYFDDFDDPSSGWPITDVSVCKLNYHPDGNYQIYVPLDFRGGGHVDTWFVNPVALAPFQPPAEDRTYCVSADIRFASSEVAGYWAVYGLVFGASDDMRYLYALEVNANGDWGVLEYDPYVFPGPPDSLSFWMIDWKGSPNKYINRGAGVNHLKVVVDGKTADYYINGQPFGHNERLDNLLSFNRVGVIGGPYEVTPIDIRVDNFTWSPDPNACP